VGLHRDAWLSDVLGFAVYAAGSEAELPASGARSLTYAKVDVSDVVAVLAFTARGFAVVDVLVTLTLGAEKAPAHPDKAVVPAAREHMAALIDIAGRCFRFSRFHLDPKIPDDLADAVKREWVRSYAEGRRGLELLAALEDGVPVGFLAVLANGDARVIDLVGVAPEAQGHGVGRALVSEFVARHKAAAAALRVGTQLANLPSLGLYESLGFRISSASYVLHLHTGA
jgi:ribosomal protein S18 acetylase RimI-like enzyme